MKNTAALRYISKCKCGAVTSALGVGHNALDEAVYGPMPAVFSYLGSAVMNCRNCGALRYAKAVAGKFSAKHECDAKCLASKGPTCECACGGKNHGASYAV